VRPGDVRAGGHGLLDDLEHRTGTLPLGERRPDPAVGVEAAYAVVRWRDVEHDEVLGVVGEHAVQVPAVHGHRPPQHRVADGGLVVAHAGGDRGRCAGSSASRSVWPNRHVLHRAQTCTVCKKRSTMAG
jgi:hypothetical protein